MISIEDLTREVLSLKMTSEQLAEMFSSAGQSLSENTNAIASHLRGSNTAESKAVPALTIASRSLLDAAASIKTLGRTCDECVAQLTR